MQAPGERADDDARQHQDQGAVVSAQRGGDQVDEQHRRERRRRMPGPRCRGPSSDSRMPSTAPSPAPVDDAEDVGRHQRIAEQGLVGRAGAGQRRADQDVGRDPRQPHPHEDDLARRDRAVVVAGEPPDRPDDVRPCERERAVAQRARGWRTASTSISTRNTTPRLSISGRVLPAALRPECGRARRRRARSGRTA